MATFVVSMSFVSNAYAMYNGGYSSNARNGYNEYRINQRIQDAELEGYYRGRNEMQRYYIDRPTRDALGR